MSRVLPDTARSGEHSPSGGRAAREHALVGRMTASFLPSTVCPSSCEKGPSLPVPPTGSPQSQGSGWHILGNCNSLLKVLSGFNIKNVFEKKQESSSLLKPFFRIKSFRVRNVGCSADKTVKSSGIVYTFRHLATAGVPLCFSPLSTGIQAHECWLGSV